MVFRFYNIALRKGRFITLWVADMGKTNNGSLKKKIQRHQITTCRFRRCNLKSYNGQTVYKQNGVL